MKRALLALSLYVSLQGCATCERHPVACRATIVIVVSGAIYGASTHHTQRPNDCAKIGLPEC
jgi:hypothetical protein